MDGNFFYQTTKSHVGNSELIDSHNYINTISKESVAYKNTSYILYTNEMIVKMV